VGKEWPGMAIALVAIAVQFPPLLSQLRLEESRAAAAAGELQRAADEAGRARTLQPWAASPHVQLALVQEKAGRLRLAVASIHRARARDSADWRIWLVSARIEAEAGLVSAARRSLERARRLNPRSPALGGLGSN